jgi:hypothetical protein
VGTAGNKVTICSKLAIPIVARLQEWRTQVREHQGQQWQERVSVFVGEAVRINGTNVPPGMAGVSGWPRIENGTALTMGVDEHFWDQFVAQNPELPAIKGGFVWKARRTMTTPRAPLKTATQRSLAATSLSRLWNMTSKAR